MDKHNGGKADSLNVALDAARFPCVLACDADTLIEPDGLLRRARPCLFKQKIAASPTHASITVTEDFELVVRLQQLSRRTAQARQPPS